MSMEHFPPRGGTARGELDGLPARTWAHPDQLGAGWDWAPSKLVLGRWNGRMIGDPDNRYRGKGKGDDRHGLTCAGTRAGKSLSILIPNLLRYRGSAVIIDPKGELAKSTAQYRAETMGHEVAVLDPFGASGLKSSSYNPFDEMDPNADTFIDDVAVVADALIIDASKDKYWTDAAKTLVRALILYMFATTGERRLRRLRKILLGREGRLVADGDDPESSLFARMAGLDAFDGLLAGDAASFLDKPEKEFGSILSTAREQLSFLDSVPLGRVLASSSLRLSQLKRKPTTIYLCLPATRMPTHSRWLRLIVSLGIAEMERDQTTPEHPVLFLLEEFAALGHMRPIEAAAGFMASFGVRLWTILQDLSQLKTHYPNSWETFVGNAGFIQCFGNVDPTTTAYLSKMLGNTLVTETQKSHVSGASISHGDLGQRQTPRVTRLLEPDEITQYFSRETMRQLLLVPGRPPIYLQRLEHAS